MIDDISLDDKSKAFISPEKTQKLLKEHGKIVTIEQAKSIVEFLNHLAEISLGVYIDGSRFTPNEFEPTQSIDNKVLKRKKVKNEKSWPVALNRH